MSFSGVSGVKYKDLHTLLSVESILRKISPS